MDIAHNCIGDDMHLGSQSFSTDKQLGASVSLESNPSARVPDAAIEVHDVVKRYRRKVALNGLRFRVPRGIVCGFLGPNGAGKTTTLRILMGSLPATSGTTRVLGLDPLKRGLELRRRVGYVSDISHIYEWMTVGEVFQFAAGVFRNWDPGECRRAAEMLSMPTARTVKQLSKGELAKLNLIVALSHRPEMLIMDEPTSGLDPLARNDFLTAVMSLARDEGTTIFFSTHILSDIERIADHLVVMKDGKAVADDSVDALRSRYTKASFLFGAPPAADLVVPGALRVRKGIREWVATFETIAPAQLHDIATRIGAADVLTQPMTVEDVFVELFDMRHAPETR